MANQATHQQETQRIQQWNETCLDAAWAATACADWCIQNDQAGVRADCVRACLDVATLAKASAGVMAREARYARTLWQACLEAGKECERMCAEREGDHESLARCASACKRMHEAGEGLVQRQSST